MAGKCCEQKLYNDTLADRFKRVYHELVSVERKKENCCQLIKFCNSSLFPFLFYRISENSLDSFFLIHTIKPAAITYIPFTSWSKLRDARIGIPSFSANVVPDSNVSRPRRSRIFSQMRSCLLPDAVVSPPRCSCISPRVRQQVWGLKRSCYCWFLFTAFKNDLGNGVSKESGSLVMG